MENKPVHSKRGASSAYRWMACPGSVRHCEGITNYSSPYAMEGSAAHLLAETCLRLGHDAGDYCGQVLGEEYKDFPVTVEMAAAVQVYLDTVRGDLSASAGFLEIEKRFHLSMLHPDIYGTNDACLYQPALKKLTVYDYKHGAGKKVEAKENPQLMYYGLGPCLLEKRRVDVIELVIVQPRCFYAEPVSRWQISPLDLLDWSGDLVEAVERTEDPSAPLMPGGHCDYCPGQAVCPAIYEKALEMAKHEFKTGMAYDPDKLREILEWLPVLETWITRTQQFAHNEAAGGTKVPGFKMVEGKQFRYFVPGYKAALLNLEPNLKPEDFVEPAPPPKERSPAQMEAALKAINKKWFTKKENGDKIKQFQALILKKSGGTVLVPESDNRPEVVSAPENDFPDNDNIFE